MNKSSQYFVSYWPTNPGLNLTRKVALIFANLRIKISQNLSNKSYDILSVEVLSHIKKYKLFYIILNQLELIILEKVTSKIELHHIIQEKYLIVLQFLSKSKEAFFDEFNTSHNYNLQQLFNYDHNMVHELENNLELLLVFSVLGSSNQTKIIFHPSFIQKIPDIQIEILFENFLIQTSNVLIDALLRTSDGINFGFQSHLFDKQYCSIRTIEQFRNNLMWYKFTNRYITIPKNIYENKYSLYVISPQGILNKHISAYRLYELSELSTSQLIVTFIIEIQDFLLPKLSGLLRFLTKVIFYIIYEPLKSNTQLLWQNWSKDLS
uniref:hypothetical protein n=1 Tax=Rhodospora sordida TaxID=362230 RepID=UPI001FCE1322|nr:hypothetical protein MW557_pgp152 [Rhodospora sordida]UNJ14942.1 hypothetical protein [Rhodospora sordida]